MDPDATGRPDDGGLDDGVGGDGVDHQGYLSTLEQVEAELADVEHALRRLDDGTYEVCEACGGAIGEERLESMPATRFCGDHESPSVVPRLF